MSDDKENNSDLLQNFMTKKAEESSSDSSYKYANKTKQRLKDARMEKKEKEREERHKAKQDSKYKASRFNKSSLHKRQTQELGALIPIIAIGLLILLVAFFKLKN